MVNLRHSRKYGFDQKFVWVSYKLLRETQINFGQPQSPVIAGCCRLLERDSIIQQIEYLLCAKYYLRPWE